MAETKFDIRTEAVRPLYAYVGVTDLVVERARDYVGDLQKQFAGVQKQVTSVELQPKALRDNVEKKVAELQADAVAFPGRVSDLVTEQVDTVNGIYADLAKRGEDLVARIRKQESTQATVKNAETTAAKAKTTTTQARKATSTTTKKASSSAKKTSTTAKKASTPARSSAKKTSTTAKKAASTTAKTAAADTKATATTAKKASNPAASSAKATGTAAGNTAQSAIDAVTDATKKIGD